MTEGAVLRDGVLQASNNYRQPSTRVLLGF